MSTERDGLVEGLPGTEVPDAVAELRLRAERPWPPSWFGAATGARSDTAARSEELGLVSGRG